MQNRGLLLSLLLVILLFSAMANAQFVSEELGGGLGFGQAYGIADSDVSSDPGLAVRAFLRRSLADHLEAELSAGITSKLRGNDFDYRTTMRPIALRLLYRPFIADSWSPYLYAGGGALHYELSEVPGAQTAGAELEGWTAMVPFGLGVQFKVSNDVSFEVSGGYTQTFSEDLNAIRQDGNDAFVSWVAGLTMSGFNWNADPDMDGLTNREEKEIGTDYYNPDTDGEGLNDGAEFHQYKTNPLMADSDNDGLNDNDEVNTHGTNPNNADTDGEGLGDKAEVATHETDPNKADTDGDNLDDHAELMTHKSDPLRYDMDNDGLSDGQEVIDTKTEFANADTDGDGLNDGDEVNTHKSNPLNVDSDGGSVADGVEVNRGTSPTLASDDVVLEVAEVGAKIVLEGVTFPSSKADITAKSEEILEKAYNTLIAYPDMSVEIHGYTDSRGSRNYNLSLSERRAQAVMSHLVGRGIDQERISAKGYGPDAPIATNETADGRLQNRRIEFVRVK